MSRLLRRLPEPAHVAEIAVTLDHISGGRFELGLGSGWAELEAIAHGYPFPSLRQRMDMVDEAFPLIKRLLSSPERHSHDGAFYRTVDLTVAPQPVRGSIPMWAGGVGESRTIPMAARHADGWNAPYISPEDFGRLNRLLDEHCEQIGRDPGDIERSVNLMFNLATDAAAEARIHAELVARWGDMADRVIGGALLGTPDRAAGRILEYVAAGADGVNIALRAPLDEEALDAYLSDVVPTVRDTAG